MYWCQSLLVYAVISGPCIARSQIFTCQDDASFEPEEGIMDEQQFTWLGILQYIHVKNGTPHYFKAPRVILISRQFVLSTAKDAAQVPDEYALGNVIFGDYERDEEECGLTPEDIYNGTPCDTAIATIPLVDVLLHPEYKHYGAENSIALLKMITPIKSAYMVPVCLPFRDYLSHRTYSTNNTLWHVDFASSVPRDFFEEEKELTRINLLPQALCYLYDKSETIVSKVAKKRVMCTTDCDFHSGAPTVVHEHTGHWTAVSIAEGSGPCPDPLRSARPPAPPRHIRLYVYVPWITAAVTGKTVKSYTSNDPFGYTLPRQGIENLNRASWVGHWWLAGLKCYKRGKIAIKFFRFYNEQFIIKPAGKTKLTYFIKLNGAAGTKIICVKVRSVYKSSNPKVWDLETSEIMVKKNPKNRIDLIRIPIAVLPKEYEFELEAWAMKDEEQQFEKHLNQSLETVSSSSDDDDDDR